MATSGVRHRAQEFGLSGESSIKIQLAKVMGLSILIYLAVPILIFLAADRAFQGNWNGVLGFLLYGAGCALLARMAKWASRNL